jgi:hypothetical protein
MSSLRALLLPAMLMGSLHAADKVPLVLELPRPLFVGTPVPVKIGNLEAPRQGNRPPFLVPVGTVNLALGKKVTSSDSEPLLGDLDQVTDGEKAGDEGNFVEIGNRSQWVQIDLEASKELHAIVVWHFHSQARVYKGVVVQVSDTKDFTTGVETLFNNDIDNLNGLGVGKDKNYVENAEGKIVDGKGIKARYVRLYSHGNTSTETNHYTEVEVYGLP